MSKYRSLKPVTYVADGKVVSVKANRTVDLTEEQAKALSESVVLVDSQVDSVFPDGAPIISPTIVRTVPATPVVGEAVEPPAPVKSFGKFDAPKPEDKAGNK